MIGTVRLVRSPITYRFEPATILGIGPSPSGGLLVEFHDKDHKRVFRQAGPDGIKTGVVWLMRATIGRDTLDNPSTEG